MSASRIVIPFRMCRRSFFKPPRGGPWSLSPWTDLSATMREMDRNFNCMVRKFWRLENFDPKVSSSFYPFERNFHEAVKQNPVVVDEQGNRKLHLQYDVRQFQPEEIKIRMVDDAHVEVEAKHESGENGQRVYREYRRLFTLPEGCNVNELQSMLSEDGILSIEAPLPKVEPPEESPSMRRGPTSIPIEKQTKEDSTV